MQVHRCIICDSVIWNDESIARGYGSECAQAVNDAILRAVLSDNSKSLHYNWLIKVDHYKRVFIETFKNTKFRKEFKRNFYASICQADRISKKQLEIIDKWLYWADVDLYKLNEDIREAKREYIKKEGANITLTRGLIEQARQRLRNN